MKYYLLSGDFNPKVIGVNNGVYQGNIIWNKFEDKKTEKVIREYFSLKKALENIKEIGPINFKIEWIDALKSAKMTDFFMYSPKLWGINFFVSTKAKDFLSQFQLPPSVFIPAYIYHRGFKYDYYGLYLATHYKEDDIDFSESVFYRGIPRSSSPKDYIEIKNIEEYKNYKGLLTPEKIFFNENFDPSLDLFDSIWSGVGYYISNKLKEAIKKAELTGIVITEPKEPELNLIK